MITYFISNQFDMNLTIFVHFWWFFTSHIIIIVTYFFFIMYIMNTLFWVEIMVHLPYIGYAFGKELHNILGV